MIVVSDTSPLNYLILIGEIECLHRLFGSIVVPPAVQRELLHPTTPQVVREWVLSPPDWLEVHPVRVSALTEPLGPGEMEAICLAEELGALLLVDDFEARSVAQQHGVAVTGTLGVLERAAATGLLSLPEALAKLRTTTFRLSAHLAEGALERNQRRREHRKEPFQSPPSRPGNDTNGQPD